MPMFKPGTIVLVNFPFTDLQSSKVRPVLVLTRKGDDVIILGIFSKSIDELRESWIKVDRLRTRLEITCTNCHSRENGNPGPTKELGSCFRRNDIR